MKLLHKGKVKEVYQFGEDKLLFNFTDQISVFDKIIPTLVPKKGEALCRTSAFWFGETQKKLGLDTHYVGLQDVDKMLVKRLQIIDPAKRTILPTQVNFFIPLEVVCRHYAAGSLLDRLASGEIKPSRLGMDRSPKKGEKLATPFIEFTTKLEDTDRPLTDAEAQKLSGLSEREFVDLKRAVLDIDALIASKCEPKGLIHVDGKKEFGMNHRRELMVVDTFGTADEDRWWDKALYEKDGTQLDLSKEMVRQHYRATGYFDQLMAARKAGASSGKGPAEGREGPRGQGVTPAGGTPATKQTEPPIPPLPAHVTADVTKLYVSLFERITGQPW